MRIYAIIITILVSTLVKAQPNFALVGYATQNGGTTGGLGGTTVTAKTYAELKSYAESTTKYIINVEGTISNGTGGGQIKIKSDKSIIGVGSTAFLSGVGLDVSSQNNIIIQNLKITLVGTTTPSSINGGDCISIYGTSKNIWIDHCEIYSENPDTQTDKDKYDGLLDIKQQTGFITISWCYFHDHHKGGLVGAADDDLSADRLVTIHHNYYNKVLLRVPMYRGATGHFFNNYIKDSDKASEIRANTCVRVEKNYYDNFSEFAIYTTSDSPGKTERIDNYLSKTQSRAYPANCTASIPYTYSNVLTTTTTDIKTIVPQYAGVGKLGTCTAKTWYKDSDGDGFGDPNSTQSSCTQPTGFVADKTDLCPNDANKIAPGQCGCGVSETACLDCYGVKNGTATLDNCGRCVGGTTAKTACVATSEIETDACNYDGVVESANAGFKGTGYINVPNAIGSKISFNVNASSAGTYTLSFRYASGGTADRPATVLLNGMVLANTLSFPATGAFTTYKTIDLNLSLKSGVNTIELTSTTADGLANIDQIGFVTSGVSKGNCLITAMDEESLNDTLTIYPNPSTSSFYIKSNKVVDVEVGNIEGRILYTFKQVNDLQFGEKLTPGVYFIKVQEKVYKICKK